jgi:hypothetical protein
LGNDPPLELVAPLPVEPLAPAPSGATGPFASKPHATTLLTAKSQVLIT